MPSLQPIVSQLQPHESILYTLHTAAARVLRLPNPNPNLTLTLTLTLTQALALEGLRPVGAENQKRMSVMKGQRSGIEELYSRTAFERTARITIQRRLHRRLKS